jgi:hypothetical protein
MLSTLKNVFLSAALLACCFNVSAQNYTFSQFTNPYQDLVGATLLSGSDLWDDTIYYVPFGFPFAYRGQNYTGVNVNTYGYLDFDQDAVLFAGLVADYTDRNYYLGGAAVSPISYTVEGAAGNRIVKIEFKNSGFYNDMNGSDYVNFQIWLYEVDNAVEVHVGSSSVPNPFDDFDAAGPGSGVLEFSNTGDPIYSYLVTGNTAAATTTTWDGLSDFPTLNGMPVEGTVYRFVPEVGQCGWYVGFSPNAISLCQGSTEVLTASPMNADSYQWYANGVAIPGATSQTLNVSDQNVGSDISVAVVLTGCADTSAAVSVTLVTGDTLFVEWGGNAIVGPDGSLNICPGDTVVVYSPAFGILFQWYVDGAPVPNATEGFLIVTEPGSYSYTMNNLQCPSVVSSSDTVSVVVHDLVVPVITESNDTLFANSAPATLQWFYNGQPIPNATGTWFIPNGLNGTYTVEASNDLGCTASSYEFLYTSTTSISQNKLTVYPNPVEETLYFNGFSLDGTTFVIADAIGKIVMSGVLTKSVTVAQLVPGVYSLDVIINGVTHKKTFVKQ